MPLRSCSEARFCKMWGLYSYYNVRAQIGAMKMKDIKPDMERVQMKMRQAQATRNMALMKSAR